MDGDPVTSRNITHLARSQARAIGRWLLGACLALAAPASALDVSPLVHTLSLEPGRSETQLTVSNTSDQPLPVEFTPYHLRMTGADLSIGAAADDDLLVFPPAAVLQPGASQIVRVQLDPSLPLVEDRSYIVLVDQVPLGFDSGPGQGVQVLLTFNVVIHVEASDSQPDLVARRTRLVKPKTLVATIANRGSGNAFGANMSLSIKQAGAELRVGPEALRAQLDDLFFPPGHRRKIRLKVPGLQPGKEPVSVDIVHEDRP